jgi:hypothetical protein
MNDRSVKASLSVLSQDQPGGREGDFSHDGWPQGLESNLVFPKKNEAGVLTVKKL